MTTTTSTVRSSPAGLLRLALQGDAGVTGLNGAAYLLAAPLLHDVLGLPTGLLRGVGMFCWAAPLRSARSPPDPRPYGCRCRRHQPGLDRRERGSRCHELGTPTTLGTTWTALQAVVVGGFAPVQWAGLRRLGGS